MKKYYIYHIKGIKIGCTQNPKIRINKNQGYTEWEILEEHIDILIASDREIELQKKYGYKVDKIPYWKSIEHREKGSKTLREIGYYDNFGKNNNPIPKKPCVAIDIKTNEIVKEFDSMLSASKWLGKEHNGHIRKCCENKRKTAYGYKWSYCTR